MSGIKRYVEQDTVLIQQPVLHAICIIDPLIISLSNFIVPVIYIVSYLFCRTQTYNFITPSTEKLHLPARMSKQIRLE